MFIESLENRNKFKLVFWGFLFQSFVINVFLHSYIQIVYIIGMQVNNLNCKHFPDSHIIFMIHLKE